MQGRLFWESVCTCSQHFLPPVCQRTVLGVMLCQKNFSLPVKKKKPSGIHIQSYAEGDGSNPETAAFSLIQLNFAETVGHFCSRPVHQKTTRTPGDAPQTLPIFSSSGGSVENNMKLTHVQHTPLVLVQFGMKRGLKQPDWLAWQFGLTSRLSGKGTSQTNISRPLSC